MQSASHACSACHAWQACEHVPRQAMTAGGTPLGCALVRLCTTGLSCVAVLTCLCDATFLCSQSRNAALRREKELMARHYGQLKAALDRGRAAAAERLKQLSVMSGTAMQVGPSAAQLLLCHASPPCCLTSKPPGGLPS